jgi:hypothetical protein
VARRCQPGRHGSTERGYALLVALAVSTLLGAAVTMASDALVVKQKRADQVKRQFAAKVDLQKIEARLLACMAIATATPRGFQLPSASPAFCEPIVASGFRSDGSEFHFDANVVVSIQDMSGLLNIHAAPRSVLKALFERIGSGGPGPSELLAAMDDIRAMKDESATGELAQIRALFGGTSPSLTQGHSFLGVGHDNGLNVNTAPGLVLELIYGPSAADSILSTRSASPIRSTDDLGRRIGSLRSFALSPRFYPNGFYRIRFREDERCNETLFRLTPDGRAPFEILERASMPFCVASPSGASLKGAA